MSRKRNKKMSERDAYLFLTIAVLACAIVALIGTVASLHDLKRKYETIMEVACSTTATPSLCKEGMNLMLKMNVPEIKESFNQFYKYQR